MVKRKFSVVFVVLVYRNVEDLRNFFSSMGIQNSKVIVVNSYYDDNSMTAFQKIAERYNADFLNVPNLGYGAGNNRGIEYALDNYDFDFLIISNADVSIRKFKLESLNINKVTAPKILTLNRKNQNPSSPFTPTKIEDYIHYKTYKGNHKKLIWLLWAYSRFTKIVYYGIKMFKKNIFSPHGAFIIIPKSILERCMPLFNENMFLFNEESHLGRKLKKNGICVEYRPDIIIDHKEDGSVSLLNESLFSLHRDSFLELYKFWYNS